MTARSTIAWALLLMWTAVLAGCKVWPGSTTPQRLPSSGATGSGSGSGPRSEPGTPLPPTGMLAGGLVDELLPIYADGLESPVVDTYGGDTPRGVPAGVHVMATGIPPGSRVRCVVESEGRPVASARLFTLVAVPVEQNTGIESRTEAWDKRVNPDVIRRAPFDVYEVLQPSDGVAQANEHGVVAFRVELPIAAGAAVESRRLAVRLTSTVDGKPVERVLDWMLRVHEAVVPPTSPSSPGYVNWFSVALIGERHGLRRWSEEFWTMLEAYADLMARGRQNAVRIRWNDFATMDEAGHLRFEQERCMRFVRVFLDRGFTQLHGGHLANRQGGDWSSRELELQLTGSDARSEAGMRELDLLLDAVNATLAELRLPSGVTYLQHITDEPTGRNAESYRFLADRVRRKMPGVRTFDATMARGLVGAVDVWCPQVQEYQAHREFFDRRHAAGDGVWVYTCLIPGGPWLNRLLDQERLRPLYFGWSIERYGLDGYLHWGLNHYRRGIDPYAQSVVPHGSGPPNFLPAGDSHVVYPGPGGPCSGQRFEAQRIGMEDAELFRLLRRRAPAAAEALVARVFRAFDDYEKDVAAYRAVRRDLFDAVAQHTD